jgi:hypothetical protein
MRIAGDEPLYPRAARSTSCTEQPSHVRGLPHTGEALPVWRWKMRDALALRIAAGRPARLFPKSNMPLSGGMVVADFVLIWIPD